MTPPAPAAWLPAAAALLFAAAHTQGPLFYSNQNQYFLHGLAAAGYGGLSADWLANTPDPTPAFSAAVAAAYRAAGLWPFQAAYFVLIAVYFRSLWGVAAALPFFPATTAGRVAFAAALTAVHSGIVRSASVRWLGLDYPWYFQAGVANQYLLGPGIQPSAFGVLLLSGLWAWAAGRPVLSGLLAAAACGMHSTYLLPAGLLVGGMVASAVAAKRPGTAARVGVVALLGVLPVVAYVLTTFRPTGRLEFGEAQAILAWVRIPHHTDVNRWLDAVAGLQLVWLVGGVVLFRRTPLFPVLALAAAGGTALSLGQVATGDATLALLFPWRVSAVLVPVATAAAAAGIARFAERHLPPPTLAVVGWLVVALAVAGAGKVYRDGLGYQGSAAEDDLIAFAARTRRPGDVYLLPASYPKPPTKRGTGSSTFVPVAQTGRPAVFELQRFRLGAGAAVFVDFKSVPYRDLDVLEWKRRVDGAAAWYATEDWDASGVLDAVTDAGVTHVVVPTGTTVRSVRFDPVHTDAAYQVYRLR